MLPAPARKRSVRAIRAPPPLQRAAKQLELRTKIDEVNTARLRRQAQEARNNLVGELQRLRSMNAATLPGLAAYMATRRGQARQMQARM